MKILIISDTHGRRSSIVKVAEKVGEVDMVIHLGDIAGDLDYVEEVFDCEIHMIAGNNDFMFSDLELRRTGTTYTADTLQILTREHPECEWYFILGADSFFQLEQW